MNLELLKQNILLKKGIINAGGQTFEIRELTGAERINLLSFLENKMYADAQAYIAGACLAGEDGGHLFDPEDEAKRKLFLSLPSSFLDELQKSISEWQEKNREEAEQIKN